MMTNATRRGLLTACLGALAGACASGIAPGGAEGDNLTAPEYRLGPGDQLRVTVFGETDLTGQYVVSSQGNISFPLLGEVPAGGRTLAELTTEMTSRLREGFLRSPSVALEVTNYRPFFILGEVRTPGTYPYSANLTVVNAVATAQGFTYRADRRRVFIMHAGESAERQYRLTTTTPVQPGDTVRIGERLF